MAAGRHFEKWKIVITWPPFEILSPFWKKENRHNSAAISDIFTKSVVLVAMDSPQCPLMLFFGYNKIKNPRPSP